MPLCYRKTTYGESVRKIFRRTHVYQTETKNCLEKLEIGYANRKFDY